jgi:protein tyrosine phosphatase
MRWPPLLTLFALAVGCSAALPRNEVTPPNSVANFVQRFATVNSTGLIEDVLNEYREKVDKYKVNGTTEAFLAHPLLNRYKGVPLLDDTRVILRNPLVNDYIHASHVNASGLPFIVSQAPLNNTVADFLEMLFENNVILVIQLCNFTESGVEKSFYYLTNGSYGDLTTVVGERKNITDSIVRTEIRLTRNNRTQTIEHIHFLGWPDYAVPRELSAFPTLYGYLEKHSESALKGSEGIVIHCTAGIGRSGTFVAAVMTFRRLLEDTQKEVKVVDVLHELRSERMDSVETPAQYLFIHRCVIELCTSTWPSLKTSTALQPFFREYAGLSNGAKVTSLAYSLLSVVMLRIVWCYV